VFLIVLFGGLSGLLPPLGGQYAPIWLTFAVFFALLPVLAFGQSVQVDGCISGRPCAFGVPLPQPTNTDTYGVDADGCMVGQPCPWRAWRASGSTTTDRPAENVYRTRRNTDGTTDVFGSNARTGSKWTQHYDPNRNLQSGTLKDGRPWGPARLAPPFGNGPDRAFDFGLDEPPNVVYEPSEQHDRRMEELSALDEQKQFNEYARLAAEARVQRDRLTMALIKSRMQPGVLVDVARAAARQRSLALTDVNARDACMKDADQK